MAENNDYVKLVKQAQLGNGGALNRLARVARERLRTDVYRLTLDNNLTQDIVQESLLEMFRVLRDLREPEKFWPWMYKIALNKLRFHRRTEKRRKTVPLSSIDEQNLHKDSEKAVVDTVSHELKEIVLNAMRQLKPRHRAVLSMRCYREMEYSTIADTMGCSEFAAKMLFYRAKKALKKQLARNGFKKGSLLMALILFGKMTAPSKAAAAQLSVTAATVKVGLAASTAGIMTSKTGVIATAAAGILAVGTLVTIQQPDTSNVLTTPDGVIRPLVVSADKQADTLEYWYYYPPNGRGAVITRLMKGAPRSELLYCLRLQNEQANYDYDKINNTVYLNNYRLWRGDMSVWQLPTDSTKMREFLSKVEHKQYHAEYIPELRNGLMIVKRTGQGIDRVWTTYHYNVLEEEYLRYNWPAGTEMVDRRDKMHRRGWTYFEVTGELNGKKVSGTGQIPFVYAASLRKPAWMRLKIGDLTIEDNGSEAKLNDKKGSVETEYEGGSFFAGLARPWMGLHTIDTIRRDAAEQQIWFETRYIPNSFLAEVQLSCEQTKLLYTINLEKDIVEKIQFTDGDGHIGQLRFSYLQDITGLDNKFIRPKNKIYRAVPKQSTGINWLIRLAQGQLR